MNRNKHQRLSEEEKKVIKDLTLSGRGLREVSKEMGLNVTTIYYHVRKFLPKRKKDFSIESFYL